MMINQIVYETFIENHRQVLLGQAEAFHMIKKVRAGSNKSNRRLNILISRLYLGSKRQHKPCQRSKEGELELGI